APATAVATLPPTGLATAAPTTTAGATLSGAFAAGGPGDAASTDQQIFREMTESFGTHIEWVKTVYNSAPGAHWCQIAMARLNQNFEMVPDAAESWEVSDDHLTWTFHT